MKIEVEIDCSEKFCRTKTKCCRFLLFQKLGTVPVCGFFIESGKFSSLYENEAGMIFRHSECLLLEK